MGEKYDVWSNQFSYNIFKQKYSLDQQEDWSQTCRRVVESVCGQLLDKEDQEIIYNYMLSRKFIPGGRYLYASGRPFHQVNNCFLFRAKDSRESWADIMHKSTAALMTGGGIGIDYSLLRGKGEKIHKTGGESTGPLALMHMVNEAGRYIMQGGARRCLPTGSRVQAKNGLIPIENIVIGQEVMTTEGYKKVSGKIFQGKQETVVIHTQNGELECTPNHRVAILDDIYGGYKWIEAQNLQKNDRLYFGNHSIDGSITELPVNDFIVSDKAYTLNRITIPKLDADIAWLLGLIHGDGYVMLRNDNISGTKRHGKVSIACSKDRPEIKDKALEVLSRFGVKVNVNDGDGDVWSVCCNSVELAYYFLKLKQPKTEISVPECIFNAKENVKAAYIAGLMDADGSDSSRPVVIAAQIYKKYLIEVQNLCSSIGISTRIKLSRRAKGNWKNLYHLTVSTGKQLLLFKEKVGKYGHKCNFKIPYGKQQCSYSLPNNFTNRLGKFKHRPNGVATSIEKIESVIGNQKYTPIKVLKITKGSLQETWDIEVEDKAEFFVNGYLVHNSAIWAGLSWSHPDIFDFMAMKNWSESIRQVKEQDIYFPAPMEGTNISVIYDTEFFIAIENKKHPLHKHAKEVWQKNCLQAFSTAEPGMSFNFLKDNESLRNAPVVGDTQILTNDGYRRVIDVVDKPITVWTGKQWADTLFKVTRKNDNVLKLTFANGYCLTCSYDHPVITAGWVRVEAQDLHAGHNVLTLNGLTTLTNVEVCKEKQDVYCCDVKVEEHSFVIDGGIIVSNCTEVVSEDDSDKCNLGTVWINRFDDRDDFARCIQFATKFLMCGGIYSDVPTEKIKEVGLKNNRIGLGLGGLHEWLILRNSPYVVTDELHKWLNVYEQESDASAFITARELGVSRPKGVRAIAPTGTIGILAETTTGIEPLFCKAYKRRYLKGEVWHYEYVIDGAIKRLIDKGVDIKSVQDAYDLTFKERVKFQADVQNYVDMSISSTCNLPPWNTENNNEASLEKNSKTLLKYAKRLRGFTCYPDGARGGQPLTRVDLEEALANEGVVFEEREHECIGGVCGI